MKEKFEKLRDLASDVSGTTIEDVEDAITYTMLSLLRSLASDVSNTTVEDANTYTILSLCDQLVDAIDVYLEDQEENKHEQSNT